MNANSRYSIYDENGKIVMFFIANHDLIEKGLKFGKLTKSIHDEMMLIVGEHGLELSQWNISMGFKFLIRPKWMLVKHN